MRTCVSAERANVRRTRHAAFALLLFCAVVRPEGATAQDLVPTKEAIAPPAELAEPIRDLLQPEAAVVMRGADRLDFWWVKGVPLESVPDGRPSWSNVPDGALVAAVRLAAGMTDARGLAMKPGVYTLRFARQPQDGDHMGVSPYREFLLVGPAADDQTGEPVGFKGAVALAKKTLGKSHPAALSLNPPMTEEPAGAILTTDEGHKGVAFSIPATLQGKAAGSLSFAVTLVGHYEH